MQFVEIDFINMEELKEDIDLMNVGYDDVLHLYKGWRRAESALKEKTRELNSVKGRVKQLQDSHVKFRSQIQALESVKELTVSLQMKFSLLQQENIQLGKENHDLSTLNRQAETLLNERLAAEQAQSKLLHTIQMEFATLRGRYEEMTLSHRDMETSLSEEQALRTAAEARLRSAESSLHTLREENKLLQSKLDSTTQRMIQCDAELRRASDQLKSISDELAVVNDTNERAVTSEAEVAVLKGDVARLLRLMEHYPAAKKFLSNWQSSEGLTFIGMPPKPTNDGSHDYLNLGNHGEFEYGAGAVPEMSIADLNHLKRLYADADPHPMSGSFEVSLFCFKISVSQAHPSCPGGSGPVGAQGRGQQRAAIPRRKLSTCSQACDHGLFARNEQGKYAKHSTDILGHIRHA